MDISRENPFMQNLLYNVILLEHITFTFIQTNISKSGSDQVWVFGFWFWFWHGGQHERQLSGGKGCSR